MWYYKNDKYGFQEAVPVAFKNIVDLHTHTDNSFDGNHSTMFLCETAFMKGLRAVAFTDHLEMDAFYKDHFD
jgi:histidinol-phosphatase (PHP family)